MRLRRLVRWLSPSLALVLAVAGVSAWASLRAARVDDQERDPTTVEEGPIVQLVRTSTGAEARCAMLLPFPLEKVWQVVTDYENYGDICDCLRAESLEHDPAGRCKLSAKAHDGLGRLIPFEA